MDAKQLAGELRRFAESNHEEGIVVPLEAIAQAADELERLQAENAELREKFEHITTFRVDLPQESKDKIEQMVHDEVERCAKPYADKLEAYERVFRGMNHDSRVLHDRAAAGIGDSRVIEEELNHWLDMARKAGWEG